jgi:hypothetical protein
MSLDVIKMIRKVSIYDMIIGIILAIPIYIISASFVVPLLVGLIVAVINFALSSTITDLLMNKKEGRYMPLYLLSFIFRIAIVSVIGYVLFAQNNYYVLAYAGGYTVNLISVSLYSMAKK